MKAHSKTLTRAQIKSFCHFLTVSKTSPVYQAIQRRVVLQFARQRVRPDKREKFCANVFKRIRPSDGGKTIASYCLEEQGYKASQNPAPKPEESYALAVRLMNDVAEGAAIFSHDRQAVYMREPHSHRLLLEIPKVRDAGPVGAEVVLCEIIAAQIMPVIRGSIRRPDQCAVELATRRHRRLENSRIRANLRYERNLVADRRREAAITTSLADRLYRRKVENAADWLNEQLKSPWRFYDSIFVYDYRDRIGAPIEWHSDLPMPARNGGRRIPPKPTEE